MTETSSDLPVQSRLALMVLGWGTIGTVYTISGLRGAEVAHVLTPTAIDRWFSFNPSTIWLYLSFFVFVPLGFLGATPARVKWLCGVMMISAAGAGVVYAFFPTTMVFPPVTQSGFNAEALKLLMRYDAVVNCLPSLHVTLTSLVLFALWENRRPWRNMLLSVWAIAIAVSILPLHRHQFVDALAGLALALFACGVAAAVQHYRLQLRVATS